MKPSLRTKLIGSFLVVILTSGAGTAFVGVRMMDESVTAEAQVENHVLRDLSAAREMYVQALADVRTAVRYTAIRFFLKEALQRGDLEPAAAELGRVRRRDGLDVLTVTDPNCVVLWRARRPDVKGDSQAGSALLRKAVATRDVAAGTETVSQGELLKEGADLAERARRQIVPAGTDRPPERPDQTAGMMLMAAAPVLDDRGRPLGVLYGGRLLNGDHRLVDRMRHALYHEETYEGTRLGTVSLFHKDVRISNNADAPQGKRGIGTPLSKEVYDRVLGKAQPWVEPARMGGKRYVTAYLPLRSSTGDVVGMLHVALFEQKFADMKRRAVMAFVGISAGAIAVSVLICCLLWWALLRPIHALGRAAERLAAGDLEQHVEPEKMPKEIAALGRTFNTMAEALKAREAQTREHAEEQILRSEKLAVIGRLAAGVAHEINNPLGSILLFSRLLLRKAPEQGLERENLERIAKEADRCKNIVHGLLEFARQREPKTENVNLNEVVHKPISLLENQALFHNIEIHEDLQPDLPPVCADASQLQQVFLNILVNAAEAMEGQGALTIRSRAMPDAGRVEMRFTDTGCGIPAESVPRLFEPFFTTKEVGEGTGLGLSISYGILQRHGGSIEVDSRVGEGSTFVVSLPTAAVHTLHTAEGSP